MHDPVRVLFICDGNSARSQMAEGLLRTIGGKGYEVYSAGLEAEGLNPVAVKVMQEIDIDISSQKFHHINDFEDLQFDYVITLCDQVKDSCLAFPRDIVNLHWECADPTEAHGSEVEVIKAYNQARDNIKQLLEAWLNEEK